MATLPPTAGYSEKDQERMRGALGYSDWQSWLNAGVFTTFNKLTAPGREWLESAVGPPVRQRAFTVLEKRGCAVNNG